MLEVPFFRWSLARLALLALAIAILAAGLAYRSQAAERRIATQRQLMSVSTQGFLANPELIGFATREGQPLFAQHCASCHGQDMKGNRVIGAPDLTDRTWLYSADLDQIQRTILYGVRSGRSKARDLTEMPAYGQRGQLGEADIANLVQYLLKLSRRPYDALAAAQGRDVYAGKGLCYDCHGANAKGDPFSGIPDLTADVWVYGGTPKDIYDSIYFGRHGMMPAWIGILTLEQTRALAAYVRASAQR